MKVVVIGAGKVGLSLAESLINENSDVVIIDKNIDSLKKAEESLDVMCIKGSGVSTSILLEAGVDKSDLLIAVTSSDEVNMVCCLTAKTLGVKHTIARIRDPQYARELIVLKEELGLDQVINPDYLTADEIARSLSFSPAMNVESFAKGRVKMVELKVTSDMSIAGKKIKDLSYFTSSSTLIGAVVRDGQVIIPNGSLEIKESDLIYVIGKPTGIYNFCKLAGKCPQRFKNIMILGGSRIAHYLTNILTGMGMKVKIIEKDKVRCMELSEQLPNALIINADGTDEEVLLSENVKDMDGFIAVTGMDEENLFSALLAKQNGVKKVIAKISRANYASIVKSLGIDNVVIPKFITTNQILKYINGNKIESLYRIIEGQAEIVEFIADESSKLINTPLKALKLPEDIIVATIVRKNEVVVPHGSDIIRRGDRVILISKNHNTDKLEEMSLSKTGGLQSELLNGIKKLGNIISM